MATGKIYLGSTLISDPESSGGNIPTQNKDYTGTSGEIWLVDNLPPFAPEISLYSVSDHTASVALVASAIDWEDGAVATYNSYLDGSLHEEDILLNQNDIYNFTGLTNYISYNLTLKAKDSGGLLSPVSNLVAGMPENLINEDWSTFSVNDVPSGWNMYKPASATAGSKTDIQIQSGVNKALCVNLAATSDNTSVAMSATNCNNTFTTVGTRYLKGRIYFPSTVGLSYRLNANIGIIDKATFDTSSSNNTVSTRWYTGSSDTLWVTVRNVNDSGSVDGNIHLQFLERVNAGSGVKVSGTSDINLGSAATLGAFYIDINMSINMTTGKTTLKYSLNGGAEQTVITDATLTFNETECYFGAECGTMNATAKQIYIDNIQYYAL